MIKKLVCRGNLTVILRKQQFTNYRICFYNCRDSYKMLEKLHLIENQKSGIR